jgi:hypothetical protein
MGRPRIDLSLYFVTDAEGPRDVVATVEAALRGGATVIQLRGQGGDGRDPHRPRRPPRAGNAGGRRRADPQRSGRGRRARRRRRRPRRAGGPRRGGGAGPPRGGGDPRPERDEPGGGGGPRPHPRRLLRPRPRVRDGDQARRDPRRWACWGSATPAGPAPYPSWPSAASASTTEPRSSRLAPRGWPWSPRSAGPPIPRGRRGRFGPSATDRPRSGPLAGLGPAAPPRQHEATQDPDGEEGGRREQGPGGSAAAGLAGLRRRLRGDDAFVRRMSHPRHLPARVGEVLPAGADQPRLGRPRARRGARSASGVEAPPRTVEARGRRRPPPRTCRPRRTGPWGRRS